MTVIKKGWRLEKFEKFVGCARLDADWSRERESTSPDRRSLATCKEKDLMKIPTDLMPLEYAAMTRELCTAYRLLEDHGELKPGDAVIVNGATAGGGGCDHTHTHRAHAPNYTLEHECSQSLDRQPASA